MAFRSEEVNDCCGDNDSNGKDDICEDMNVRCLYIDIVVKPVGNRVHFLIRCQAGNL